MPTLRSDHNYASQPGVMPTKKSLKRKQLKRTAGNRTPICDMSVWMSQLVAGSVAKGMNPSSA